MSKIIQISRERFFILCLSKMTLANSFFEEIEWYESIDLQFIAVLCKHRIDGDYNFMIFGRNRHHAFQPIFYPEEFNKNLEKTRELLYKKMYRYIKNEVSNEGTDIYDTDKSPVGDLFQISRYKNINPIFLSLANDNHFSPAKGVIAYLSKHFIDPDKVFIKDFQGKGFNGRLWELFLWLFLKENQIDFKRKLNEPDFNCTKSGVNFFIEATTIQTEFNPNVTIQTKPRNSKNIIKEELIKKYRKSLDRKRKKNYISKPLIYAIHNFSSYEKVYSDNISIIEFLYGIDQYSLLDPLQNLKVVQYKKRNIAGYFFQEDTQSISAIIHSNQATISKFNRIGYLCGFGDKNLNLIYFGECFKEDPNSGMPDKFSFEVIPRKYNENWSMGVDIFHNPNATTKLPFDYFPYCNHHYFNDEHQFCSIILNLAPYWSKIYIN